ncbi:hypothetical protein EVAR_3388_1 [Eumeta japonica]|uniref:Uncharacterized protein n=1 Tax=Eumeta variegata TaxID=151549 RepID=A0A4C1SSE1_EUMVA|nr:hypothetical protein EVAR_3388_1 [Eumeta japonica]
MKRDVEAEEKGVGLDSGVSGVSAKGKNSQNDASIDKRAGARAYKELNTEFKPRIVLAHLYILFSMSYNYKKTGQERVVPCSLRPNLARSCFMHWRPSDKGPPPAPSRCVVYRENTDFDDLLPDAELRNLKCLALTS